MADSSHRATIIAAVIGAVGAIVVALIPYWDKLADSPKHIDSPPIQPSKLAQPTIPVTPIRDDVASVINIAGSWRDPNNPDNGSRITQAGKSFQFDGWGVLPQGIPFESTGSGTVTGQDIESTYTTRYQNGWVARGNCSGAVSRDGSQITSTCTDNVLGTFVLSGVRQ
jgi:hypothetical protein